nr:NAD(P)-binding domain-containing protein [Kibdelosporangium sp. MJ126-NF4]CEL13769.1 Pyrroline-5-carboxylate reductase [Kibdelosporangium sp. MJ126-NF4]
MNRIGIIGVGEIGRAIVTGLCDGPDTPPEVYLSPRGARAAAELSERYDTAHICADNQTVIDHTDMVIIAVRPHDRHDALAGLTVTDDKTIINIMSGVANDDLRHTLATHATLVRAIPLPAIRDRDSITVTCPAHPAVDALFQRLGGCLPVTDETTFNVFSALTGTLTTHFQYLATLTSWASSHGIPPEHADQYIRSLFHGLSRALDDNTRTLHQLAADHETPQGNNERIRTTWLTPANTDALTTALDGLLTHLNQPT